MKTLIVYYSRSGVTEKVAKALAEKLTGEVDLEKLIDTKNRDGVIGYAAAAKDAVFKKAIPTAPLRNDPADYDFIVVATPVWANTMSTATRYFLENHGSKIAQAAVFCTTGKGGIRTTNLQMEELIAGNVIASMGILQKAVKRDEFFDALDQLAEDIEENYRDLPGIKKATFDLDR